MQKLVVDPATQAKLNNLDVPLEFHDPSGKILGHFLPEDVYKELVLAWAEANITEEELERRRREPRGRKLAEIWKSPGESGQA